MSHSSKPQDYKLTIKLILGRVSPLYREAVDVIYNHSRQVRFTLKRNSNSGSRKKNIAKFIFFIFVLFSIYLSIYLSLSSFFLFLFLSHSFSLFSLSSSLSLFISLFPSFSCFVSLSLPLSLSSSLSLSLSSALSLALSLSFSLSLSVFQCVSVSLGVCVCVCVFFSRVSVTFTPIFMREFHPTIDFYWLNSFLPFPSDDCTLLVEF